MGVASSLWLERSGHRPDTTIAALTVQEILDEHIAKKLV